MHLGNAVVRQPERLSAERCDQSLVVTFARRAEKESSPEKTSHIVLPSSLIYLGGKLLLLPGPTSQFLVKYAVVHGPQGSGAS